MDEKKIQAIEKIKNMSDREADILEIYIAGFRSGIRTFKIELENQQTLESSQQTV